MFQDKEGLQHVLEPMATVLLGRPGIGGGRNGRGNDPATRRLGVEALEHLNLLSAAPVAVQSVSELIAAINAANVAGGTHTITLSSNTGFQLTAADVIDNENYQQYGPTGLPVITGNLTIVGIGDTIAGEADPHPGDAHRAVFSALRRGPRGCVTLDDLTLQGGGAIGAAPPRCRRKAAPFILARKAS